jgi:putative iron-dependent peroxidase
LEVLGPVRDKNWSVPIPQPGIFALGTRSHHHLQFEVTGDPHEVAPAVHRIREAANTIAGVNVVVGFGHRTWAELAPDEMPVDLAGFEPVRGPDGFEIPAAQQDVWLWLHAHGPDNVFNIARVAARELGGCARLVAEQPAFTYQASQDLTGFEDGTENPPVDEAPLIATIPEGLPCAGGSIVLVQRWLHDLDGMEALELADRELVIGRTLQGSVELDEERQSPHAHISRVVIEDDEGEELEVFRRSVAFGGVQEHGLQFVAFSADRARLQRMLERMAGIGDGVRDRLTEFSTPVASAWYVTPPLDVLARLGGT